MYQLCGCSCTSFTVTRLSSVIAVCVPSIWGLLPGGALLKPRYRPCLHAALLPAALHVFHFFKIFYHDFSSLCSLFQILQDASYRTHSSHLSTCPWAGPCWPSCRCDETAGNCSSALSIEDIWESDTLWFPGSLAKQGARSWQPHGVARASGGGRWARALCALLPCPVRSNPRWTVPPGDRRSLPVTFSLAIRLGPAFSLGADCFVAGKETDPLAWLEHAQRQRNSSERLFGMQPLTCKPVLLLMLRSATWRCLVD